MVVSKEGRRGKGEGGDDVKVQLGDWMYHVGLTNNR